MNNPLSTEEKQHIRVLLLAGQSHNAIAKQVGRSQSTVSAFATREGISPANPAPRVAIERRKEFALEARLEATGELMAKVLEIAETAESGREIKECAVAWGVLCDKSAIMEGLPSSRTETHKTRGAGTINLEEEFARLDKLQDEAVEREQRERFGVSEYGSPGSSRPGTAIRLGRVGGGFRGAGNTPPRSYLCIMLPRGWLLRAVEGLLGSGGRLKPNQAAMRRHRPDFELFNFPLMGS